MDYSTYFHTRRMKNRGHRLLDKSLLYACIAALVVLAWSAELVVPWLAGLAAQILVVIACVYFGRFVENTKQLHRKEREYVPTSMPILRRLP